MEVHEKPHEFFLRDGDDLHCTVTVPMVDAALGTAVTVDGILDDAVEVAVAPAPNLARSAPCAAAVCRA